MRDEAYMALFSSSTFSKVLVRYIIGKDHGFSALDTVEVCEGNPEVLHNAVNTLVDFGFIKENGEEYKGRKILQWDMTNAKAKQVYDIWRSFIPELPDDE